MRARHILKATALVTTAALYATSIAAGIYAYDLSSYPAKFVNNGIFNGNIVIGQTAQTSDVLGAIDIAASLQVESTTKTIPVYHGEVLSGDAKAINGGKLQIRKKPSSTLTENDIKAFATRHVSTSSGDTDYSQYLRVGATGLQQATANYLRNYDNQLEDYFVLSNAAPFFEWEIRFPSGFKSKRSSDGSLNDYDDATIAIVGMNSTIVSSSINSDGTGFSMTLMGGSIADTLQEGNTKTYTLNGTDYEITPVFISNPSSGGPQVKFSVNGELTHPLQKGSTETLSDGLQLGVRDVLVNDRQGVVGFYVGARKITITDPTTAAENFDGSVEVNNQNIPQGQFQVVGNLDANSTFSIAWMKYRYTIDPQTGSYVYMPQNGLLHNYIRRPEGMLSDINFHYHGILPAETRNFSITATSDDQYSMKFSNVDGLIYTFPLISNRDGTWKYGSDRDDLIFVEGADITDCNIGINDYFIVSNQRTGNDADKSGTHVLRYTDYDSGTHTLRFERLSDHKILQVPVSSTGVGYLIPSSSTFKVNVSDVNAAQPNIGIDLDADGAYNHTVKVVTWGGVIMNLAQNVYLNTTNNATLSNINSIYTVVGNGKTISGNQGFSAGSGFVQMSAQVLAKKFDTPTTDETFNWTISQASNNKLDLAMASTEYAGPLKTDYSDQNTGFMLTTDPQNTDHTSGLTDWGISIDKDSPASHPSALTLAIPLTQRYTQMFVSVGKVIHGGLPASSDKVNPIGVGLAILDTDAPEFGTENMIIVGGPCANTMAADFLGNPVNCAEGFAPGNGVIQAKEYDDNVAILVAGYNAQDTLGASRVLAAYKKYKLGGEKAAIVTTDLTHLIIADGG